MATQERDPRPYELMTVFIPELSEEDNQGQIERVEAYISNAGGSVTETLITSPWGRRRLAYTIRFNGVDYRDGFYTVYHFDSRPTLLTELERDLKLDTNVMRYLLVHDDPKAGEPVTEGEGTEAGVTDGAEAAAGAVAAVATEATGATEAPEAPEAPAEAPTAEAETTTVGAVEAGTVADAAESSDTPTDAIDEALAESVADVAPADGSSDDTSTDKE